MKLILRPGIY